MKESQHRGIADEVKSPVAEWSDLMKDDDDPLKVENTSGLTDADWVEINRCKRAYQEGGKAKLSQIMNDLAQHDPIRHMTVVGAFWPDVVREAIRDGLAERGMDGGTSAS